MAETIITPPNPALRFQDESRGQQILSMVRSLENEENQEEYDRSLEKVTSSFQNLIQVCSMQGLLQGNREKAELILASSAGNDSSTPNKDNNLKKKRGRKKSEPSTTEPSSAAKDESLLFSAILRILGWSDSKLQAGLFLVKLCADLCVAMSEYVKSNSTVQFSRIGSAEYELISSSGIPLLKALCNTSSQLLLRINTNKDETLYFDVNLESVEKEVIALRGCLKSAASLVDLFGTKLSRSSGLVSDLHKLGLSCLSMPCNYTQTTAAKLLATLPLTGAIYEKGTTVGEHWSRMLMDSVTGLSEILRTLAPVSLKKESESSLETWQRLKVFGEFLDQTKLYFHARAPSERQRAPAFRCCVHGIFQLTISLLERDYNCLSNDSFSLDTRICMEEMLNLLEQMMSFSFGAEKLFYATKKRLRSEVIEGGVFSPVQVVTEVATTVNLFGHQLFTTIVSALSYPSLLPHANRILRMASNALFHSTSASVKKAVDHSTVSTLKEAESSDWLSTSIALRTQAAKTFTVTISMFGFDPSRNQKLTDTSSWFNNNTSTAGAEKCISAIGGTIMEQLWLDTEESSDWGTFEEKIDLAQQCIQSLESTIQSCGGFLPLEVRVLVDSIASACLDAITKANTMPVSSCPQVKVAIIQLACACISAPWPTGASSSLHEKLFKAAHQCRIHGAEITAASLSALRLCASLTTPRVPALHIDKQIHDFSGSSKIVSARSLVAGIQKVIDQNGEQVEAVDEEDSVKEEKQLPKRMKQTHSGKTAANVMKKTAPTETKEADVLPKSKADSTQKTNDEVKDPAEKQASPLSRSAAKVKAGDQIPSKSDDGDEADDDDFLPDIVDDDGPDEEDA